MRALAFIIALACFLAAMFVFLEAGGFFDPLPADYVRL